MKKYFTLILLICGINGFSQTQYTINLEGGFQAYNNKSIYLGTSIKRQNTWKIKESDTFRKSVIYYERFINEPEIEKTNILGYTFLLGIKHFNTGINVRHLFLNKSHRLDIGPMFQVGYKYAWISYSIDLIAFDNPYSDNQNNIVNVNKYEHNIKLIIIVPIFIKK